MQKIFKTQKLFHKQQHDKNQDQQEDEREQYVNHLEDLLLLYTTTIRELNYMLGE